MQSSHKGANLFYLFNKYIGHVGLHLTLRKNSIIKIDFIYLN